MPVSFEHLRDGIAYKVGYDVNACAEVNTHRNERMPQVVYSYAFNARFLDIAVESVRYGVFVYRSVAAEVKI